MSELRIKNRNESDLRSCEVTKQLQRKPSKTFEASTGFDLRNAGAMLYRLSYR